ncbi:unnamed protein product [Diatraea saccharalis]|uniref:Dol-P-Glc:Glc(2)Man(9)GlcNAc(2)-PP-Dol alpha-1,2-glucosyltransferase n=1 Tax=Diatraea saccharalis TaxID=40085 RepID=A0A9N9R5K7_9NEOP|nr:unnamed protein product [Diatraea saccharalis]
MLKYLLLSVDFFYLQDKQDYEMKPGTKYYLALFLTVTTYFGASKILFDKVNETIHVVIDELFHIPQGLAFCQYNFTYWDPKITTLPGLYFVSAAFLGSYFPCNTYNLRFINLAASCVNLILFASILKFVYGANDYIKTVIQALNLALLPPLYFFSHVYYTDTLSLTFLLIFSRLCFTNRHKLLIFIFGLCSVFMRQTNIIWIAMVFGHKALDIFIRSSRVFGNQSLTRVKLSKASLIARDVDSSKLKRYYGLDDFLVAFKYHVSTCMVTFFKFLSLQDVMILFTHSLILMLFIAFIYYNGSIVVGDKDAHKAVLHIPQVLYFLLFYGVFGLPYVLNKSLSTLKLIATNKIKVILFGLLLAVIVHYNTVIHPYLLADNRHYTFYVWNRWFGKYDFAIYATIPVYIFLLFNLYDNLCNQNCISFLLPYSVCMFVVLALQKMIEVRYFLVPYIILRLRFVKASNLIITFEFLWYLSINFVTFYLFFNKEIYWKDFDYAQRLIW